MAGTLLLYKELGNSVRSVHFLDESQLLVAANDRIQVLSTDHGTVLREREMPGEVRAMVVTPAGAEALVGTSNGAIHRVLLSSMAITQSRVAHDAGGRLRLAISPDGSLLAVPTQGHRRVALLDARTLEPVAHLPGLQEGTIAFLEFDPKGRHIAFVDAYVRLWDLGLVEGELASSGLGLGVPTSRPTAPPTPATAAEPVAVRRPVEVAVELL